MSCGAAIVDRGGADVAMQGLGLLLGDLRLCLDASRVL